MLVDIGGRIPEAHRTVLAAREDDGEFRVEGNEAFEDARRPIHRRPCRRRIVARHDPHLTLAVIAHAAGLEDRGRPDLPDRPFQVGKALHRSKGCRPPAKISDEALF
jgi:hypothetical protein